MPRPFNTPARLSLCAAILMLAGCKSLTEPLPPRDDSGPPVSDEARLLTTMTFEEAGQFTSQQLEMPQIKVAAQKIDVLKSAPDGSPRRVRARGRVYVEIDDGEPARILCHEAYLAEDEVIVRGRPILLRGGSMIEGVDEYTVFYMYGRRIRVIGNHRLITEAQALGQPLASNPGRGLPDAPGSGQAIPYRPSPLPQGAWSLGPNPLLPPLSPDDVPENVRRELRGKDLPPPDDAPSPAPAAPKKDAPTPPAAPAKPPAPAKPDAPVEPKP